MTTRKRFEEELNKLNIELIKMGASVEQSIKSAAQALESHDVKLAAEVIEEDRAIDDMEKAIESRCLSIILRQQPVAGDLRVVSTALKMVTDMERIGDQASDIADLVINMESSGYYSLIEHIPEMARAAIGMVDGAIAAFVNDDAAAAKEIIAKDDIVDELFGKVKNELCNILKEEPENSDMAINFLMIAKYFERIGDHAENICDWIEFAETGEYKNNSLI